MGQRTKRYTVITGASSGIGSAAAKAFAAREKNLILVARRGDRLEALRHEILERNPVLDVVLRIVDLSSIEETQRFYEGLGNFRLETWINNAGFGSYALVAKQDPERMLSMVRLNVEALTLLSTLFVRDYRDVEGTQLINVSSAGGYTIVPTAVTYCAAKFYVSAFTEGLARELQETGAALRAKVLAPAATKTEFGMRANQVDAYDYDQAFGTYHTAEQMAAFLLELYDSDHIVGRVDRESFQFQLVEPLLPYAGGSAHNQSCHSFRQ